MNRKVNKKMPIHRGIDNTGRYYQYGNNGTKYYFKTTMGEKIAYSMALSQAKAIHANQSRSYYY